MPTKAKERPATSAHLTQSCRKPPPRKPPCISTAADFADEEQHPKENGSGTRDASGMAQTVVTLVPGAKIGFFSITRPTCPQNIVHAWNWGVAWPWDDPERYETEHGQIASWVKGRLRVPEDVAEDAASHAFAVAVETEPTFTMGCQREAWAKRVSKHFAIDEYRKHRGLRTGLGTQNPSRNDHDET